MMKLSTNCVIMSRKVKVTGGTKRSTNRNCVESRIALNRDVNKVQRRPIKVPKSELCQKLGHHLKLLIYIEVQREKWCSGDADRI